MLNSMHFWGPKDTYQAVLFDVTMRTPTMRSFKEQPYGQRALRQK